VARPKGSKNKVTDAMKRDILAVYRKLGGRKFLAEWAEENPGDFVRQCLGRVMPPAPKAEPPPEGSPPAQLPNFEVARRIAFTLASAEVELRRESEPEPKPIEVEPEPEPVSVPSTPYPPVPPVDEAPPIEEEETLENRIGSAAEQGLATRNHEPAPTRTVQDVLREQRKRRGLL